MLRPERRVRADDGIRRGWHFTTILIAVSTRITITITITTSVEGVKGWWIGKRRRRRWHRGNHEFDDGKERNARGRVAASLYVIWIRIILID